MTQIQCNGTATNGTRVKIGIYKRTSGVFVASTALFAETVRPGDVSNYALFSGNLSAASIRILPNAGVVLSQSTVMLYDLHHTPVNFELDLSDAAFTSGARTIAHFRGLLVENYFDNRILPVQGTATCETRNPIRPNPLDLVAPRI